MGRMKAFLACRRVRNILLRAESGEASPEELDRARAHVNECQECREAEAFHRAVAGAWRTQEIGDAGAAWRERTLRAALRQDRGREAGKESPRRRWSLRWGPVTAGLAVFLVAAVFLRGGSGPPQVDEPPPAKALEWSNGVEEALVRISGETAALWNGILPPEPGTDPVGEGIEKVEEAVAELRFSREEAWSYGFERRLHGLARETAGLATVLESL